MNPPGHVPDIPRIAENSRLGHGHSIMTMKTRIAAILRAQFIPVKTLRQLIQDRNVCRASISTVLLVVLFV